MVPIQKKQKKTPVYQNIPSFAYENGINHKTPFC